ncbi:MAG: tRNA pseudouridine(55) synthase TruB [Lachnospiraceae bacterium]|nr:tRNA pseudouridine(55) synthase TruB [Lachnospiraceae bacterium]MDE7030599.1 tRNA pseudouridine(55) synthase TruB [Lachnospiraceae bacterium]
MINGIMNIYKEPGFTSHDVVAKLRGIVKQKKIGHTGTLDPDAVGVLPVCFGSATKLCDMMTDKSKEYEAVMRLGVTTDTQDMSGKILTESAVLAAKADVEDAVMGFVGGYEQIPPMYSALKVNGKKLYELAREGKEVERQPRHVDIPFIRILDISLPEVRFVVGCSKGTYIRTLCADIGEALGCGAAMVTLKRTRVGSFRIEDSISLSRVEELMQSGEYAAYVVAPDSVFWEFEGAVVKQEAENALRNGNKLFLRQLDFERRTFFEDGDIIRVYNGKREFKAVYTFVKSEGAFKPYKMFL